MPAWATRFPHPNSPANGHQVKSHSFHLTCMERGLSQESVTGNPIGGGWDNLKLSSGCSVDSSELVHFGS